MKPKIAKVYQLKITLEGIEPPIWRRIQVPDAYSFWDLHVAIQDAMGWQGTRPHAFRLIDPVKGGMVEIGVPDHYDPSGHLVPGWECPIADYFTLERRTARYEYDFGDSWQHAVELEEIAPRPEKSSYPKCLDGERNCPPEDCGGVSGYEDFLEAIDDPEHDEHDEMLTWIGGEFDPDDFRPKQVKFADPAERHKECFGGRTA